jgi:hypothetical protein
MTEKRSIEKNRARMLKAALETTRYAATALIEFLDGAILQDATGAEIDQIVAQLGGADELLIGVLDDALDYFATERNNHIAAFGLDLGDATYKVK